MASINELDYEIIQRQLGILMNNSVAFAGKLHSLLVTTQPMDVELTVWTSENTYETITVPNRAKGSIPALYGKGSPENVQEGSYGAIYVDIDHAFIYVKSTLSGTTGWKQVLSQADLDLHNQNPAAHEGVLAQINGDATKFFEVADVSTDGDEEGTYAVNKQTLYKLLGGLENLKTEKKENLVEAVNEVIEISEYDAGCINYGSHIVSTNHPDIMMVSGRTLTVFTPFVCKAADGTKHSISNELTYDLLTLNIGVHNVYIDLDNKMLVLSQGKYYKSPYTPYFMQEGDCWLNTGFAPYRFQQMTYNNTTKRLELKTRNYVHIGTVDWRS